MLQPKMTSIGNASLNCNQVDCTASIDCLTSNDCSTSPAVMEQQVLDELEWVKDEWIKFKEVEDDKTVENSGFTKF